MESRGYNLRVRDPSHFLPVCLLQGILYIWTRWAPVDYSLHPEHLLLDNNMIATTRQERAKNGGRSSSYGLDEVEDEELSFASDKPAMASPGASVDDLRGNPSALQPFWRLPLNANGGSGSIEDGESPFI